MYSTKKYFNNCFIIHLKFQFITVTSRHVKKTFNLRRSKAIPMLSCWRGRLALLYLTPALCGGEWLASSPCHSILGKEPPVAITQEAGQAPELA
jgi:hypothetical protein